MRYRNLLPKTILLLWDVTAN